MQMQGIYLAVILTTGISYARYERCLDCWHSHWTKAFSQT